MTLNIYYLLYTNNKFIAEVIVVYNNQEIVSATLSIDLVEKLNISSVKNSEFILTVTDNEYVFQTVESNEKLNLSSNVLNKLTKLDTIYISNNNQTRSGRVLDLTYVAQPANYMTCWACAALSYGWFYYPNKCSNYDPIDVCNVSKGTPLGGTIDHTKIFLEDYFDISMVKTTTVLSKSTIINYINTSKPIIVGYKPSSGMRHIVILAGYDASSTSSEVNYYFRDSYYSTYQIVNSTSSPSTYVSKGVSMTWSDTLYKR